MSYLVAYFGKEANDISYDDIVKYFSTPQSESDKIEFKSFAPHVKSSSSDREEGILRTICAMLNSSGGIIIWGAPSDSVSGDGDRFFGALTSSPVPIGRDRFMNRVSDLITPTPPPIQMIELAGPEGYVYVFHVLQSNYSPHQFKNVYLMRIDGQTRPAPHHFIEALFRRITYPNLEGYLTFSPHQPLYEEAEVVLEVKIIIFNLSKLQNEFDLGFRLVTSVGRFADKEASAVTDIVLGGSGLRCSLAAPILYYNEPFVRTVFLHISYMDVRRGNNMIRFELYFAGKQSPLKVASYRFYADIISNRFYIRDEVREENVLISERGDPDMSERERIAFILNLERTI
jgi:hypothetical protein